MHIVHTVPSISEEASGPSYSVVRLCESIIHHGNRVQLAALDWGPICKAPSFLKTFPLGGGPRRLGRSPGMKQWLFETAREGGISVIHNHSLWMMTNVYPGLVANKLSLPLVVSPRGTLSNWAMESGSVVKKVFWPIVQRPALSAVSVFHATAEAEYEDIRRHGFCQPVAIIPNGIDIPELQPKKHSASRTLLFLGRIHPVKGIDTLLQAWGVIQDRFPGWCLRIVGPDNDGYLEKMRRLANELLLERIDFCGALHGEKKWLAYRNADLFVLPSHSENFGVSVAESLAAGTPAIVSKEAPWAGLEKKQAGWWIDNGVDPLVACLEEALASPSETLSAMGQSGRNWMKDDYAWTHVGQQMVETYRWILHGGQKPAWVILD